jgi:hypothetical protein
MVYGCDRERRWYDDASPFTEREPMRHRPLRSTAALLAAALAAVLAACGGDDGGGGGPTPRTACDYGGYCNEYEGSDLDVASTNATCTQSGATALPACRIEGALGLCTRVRDRTTIRGYHYDPSTLAAVRSSCLAIGDTWTTP